MSPKLKFLSHLVFREYKNDFFITKKNFELAVRYKKILNVSKNDAKSEKIRPKIQMITKVINFDNSSKKEEKSSLLKSTLVKFFNDTTSDSQRSIYRLINSDWTKTSPFAYGILHATNWVRVLIKKAINDRILFVPTLLEWEGTIYSNGVFCSVNFNQSIYSS